MLNRRRGCVHFARFCYRLKLCLIVFNLCVPPTGDNSFFFFFFLGDGDGDVGGFFEHTKM